MGERRGVAAVAGVLADVSARPAWARARSARRCCSPTRPERKLSLRATPRSARIVGLRCATSFRLARPRRCRHLTGQGARCRRRASAACCARRSREGGEVALAIAISVDWQPRPICGGQLRGTSGRRLDEAASRQASVRPSLSHSKALSYRDSRAEAKDAKLPKCGGAFLKTHSSP